MSGLHDGATSPRGRESTTRNSKIHDDWARLARDIKAEIDQELEAYRGAVSLPFKPGKHKRIAVKIVDDRGESLNLPDLS
jgi:adenine-specific DNA-methyltransferase